MRKEAAQKALPPPDEETVRREHLRAGAAAPDLATVKDFLGFYIATSRPRLDANRPTTDSVNIVAEWFFAGFTRVTGTDTNEDEMSEVHNMSWNSVVFLRTSRNRAPEPLYQWVRRTLTLEGIVVNKHRPKHNFTMRDLTRVLLTLWTRDDLIFIPERYRVQTTFIIHVYCWLAQFSRMGYSTRQDPAFTLDKPIYLTISRISSSSCNVYTVVAGD